jgi:hypothetical protein
MSILGCMISMVFNLYANHLKFPSSPVIIIRIILFNVYKTLFTDKHPFFGFLYFTRYLLGKSTLQMAQCLIRCFILY